MSRTATPADVIAGSARWCVVEGDALDVVTALPVACLDAVVTDPPSGIAFMGAEWDRDKGGRAQWVAWLAAILAHARTATRDGGRALVWSLPRTSHWTGCAVEDAGWAVETTVTHIFGTGWPKGSSQLKPAAETWWLARTGRSTPLNVDECRVGTSKNVPASPSQAPNNVYGKASPQHEGMDGFNPNVGRYPPNLVLSHSPGCVLTGTRQVLPNGQRRFRTEFNHSAEAQGYGGAVDDFATATNPGVDPDGTETVDAWECVEGCPVRELDAQSGELTTGAWNGHRTTNKGNGVTLHPFGAVREEAPRCADTGGASRFFPQFPADPAVFQYVAKPSRAERNAGVEGGNIHSTVKSVALMRWLVRLVTRPGDVVLDPFGGSGTTAVAAIAEGRRVVLVEREPRFAEIARQRCEHVTPDLGTPVRVAARPAPAADPRQLGLFGGDR